MMLSDLAQSALDLLFPPRCAGCGAAGAVFCAACQGKLVPPAEPLCQRCGRSLASSATPQRHSLLCLACSGAHGLTALTQLRAVALHEGPVREAIHALKYQGKRRVAVPLGDLLARYLQQQMAAVDVIIPVPLHSSRQRERGFNQAELLARCCAGRLGVPYLAQALVRQRATAQQVGLSGQERRANVANAFAAGRQGTAAQLAGKRILLIDDVTTTGSTLDAAAAALAPLSPASLSGLAVTRPAFD